MEQTFFDWLLGLPQIFADLGTWLITPIDTPFEGFQIMPLAMIGAGAIGLVVIFKIVRLVIG